MSFVKPILKWVGGKTQILDKLFENFPKEMNNYHEIFLGGGSVLLALLSHIQNGNIKVNQKIYAYDLNEPLIYMYKNIQSNHESLHEQLQVLINELNSLSEDKAKEDYYYRIRNEYNKLNSSDKNTVHGSAMLIFLNKTCFRGLYRIGPKGFNVPYGHYKKPKIINRIHLDKVHQLIQNVVFECCDFTKSMNRIEINDFVYLDPPYAPEMIGSFVKYTDKGFNLENHRELFTLIHKLTEKDIKIVVSNADVSLVRDTFKNNKYIIESIMCKRTINPKKPDSKTKEVIIRNFND